MAKNTATHKQEQEFNVQIMDLMRKSPTSFHVAQNNVEVLKANGFKQLRENES